jgi:hypothetical protein
LVALARLSEALVLLRPYELLQFQDKSQRKQEQETPVSTDQWSTKKA